MESRLPCRECKFEEKKYIGQKFKICAYCLQPVVIRKARNEVILIDTGRQEEAQNLKAGHLRENTSFLTTSGAMFFGVFGLHLSFFNAFVFGIIAAILMVGFIKPTIITLKFFGIISAIFLLGGKFIECITSVVNYTIEYFELWKLFEIKDELTEGFCFFIFSEFFKKYR